MIQESIQLLGLRAKDKITGYEGVITSVSFDLYGCVCAVVTPGLDRENKRQQGEWFDIARLDVGGSDAGDDRVMPVPDFKAVAKTPAAYNHGPEDKPVPSR